LAGFVPMKVNHESLIFDAWIYDLDGISTKASAAFKCGMCRRDVLRRRIGLKQICKKYLFCVSPAGGD